MFCATKDYRTKRAFKNAVTKGPVEFVQKDPLGGKLIQNGQVYIQGSQWHAQCMVFKGKIVEVL